MRKYNKVLRDFCNKVYYENLWSTIYRKTNKDYDLYLELVNSTQFLNNKCGTKERVYCVRFDIYTDIVCPTCFKPSKLNRRKYIPGYCNASCAGKFIDPILKLSNAQKNGLKSAETIRTKIDTISGLTILELTKQKISKTKNIIDSETGLTAAKLSGVKQRKSLNIVNLETGLSRAQEISIKTKETMSKIDPETGLTGYQYLGINLSEALTTINLETGLSRAQEISIKTKETMSKIDPETGLTGYQLANIKTKETMSKIDPETGLTGYQLASIKTATIIKISTFQKIKKIFNSNYTLLTTENQYIKSKHRHLKYSCNKCNSIIQSYYKSIRCTTCYPYNTSVGENEVLEYCQSLSSNVLSGNRQIIKPLELDVYLTEHNLAIEYDGLYWHSSSSTDSENKDYHLNKTELCQEQGIQLFHIFENEWVNPIKQNIWKSIIKNKLGKSSRIYARKTTGALITSKDKKQFLIDNHLQGDCMSSVNLGLYLDDELVSVMTFGKSRYNKKVDWELLRFCNRLETSVVGGASKLLAAFRRENVGSIISYADKRRSTGGLYEALGFEMSHESKPNYWYINCGQLESRIKYQKHKLKDILDVFNPDKTESENMYENGYRKIYDCGNQVYILRNSN